jgi:hypothetical protein
VAKGGWAQLYFENVWQAKELQTRFFVSAARKEVYLHNFWAIL